MEFDGVFVLVVSLGINLGCLGFGLAFDLLGLLVSLGSNFGMVAAFVAQDGFGFTFAF